MLGCEIFACWLAEEVKSETILTKIGLFYLGREKLGGHGLESQSVTFKLVAKG